MCKKIFLKNKIFALLLIFIELIFTCSICFSEQKRITIFRKLWLSLAESEKELGLNITDEQIQELKDHLNDINFEVAEEREKVVRHDVMAHIYAYGLQCPKAAPIIHLGATSCYVTDNADIITISSTIFAPLTMSPPIVFATPVLIIAPKKFKPAAIIIACVG